MRVDARPIQQELVGNRTMELPRMKQPQSTDSPEPLPGGSPQDSAPISNEMVKAAADAANAIAGMFGTTVEFSVHEETGFEMIRIVDSRTNMVLREMPPHEILDMIARMWEAIGVFVDKKA